jgi:hypothetical protein
LCSCSGQPELIWDIKITEENVGEIVEIARSTGEVNDEYLRLLEARIVNSELDEDSPYRRIDSGSLTVLDAMNQQKRWEERKAREQAVEGLRGRLTVTLEKLVISGTDTGYPWTVELTYVNTSEQVIQGFSGVLNFGFTGDFVPTKRTGEKKRKEILVVKEPARSPTPLPALALQGIEVKAKSPFRDLQPGGRLRVERGFGESQTGDPRWPSGTYSLEDLRSLGVTVTWEPSKVY